MTHRPEDTRLKKMMNNCQLRYIENPKLAKPLQSGGNWNEIHMQCSGPGCEQGPQRWKAGKKTLTNKIGFIVENSRQTLAAVKNCL